VDRHLNSKEKQSKGRGELTTEYCLTGRSGVRVGGPLPPYSPLLPHFTLRTANLGSLRQAKTWRQRTRLPSRSQWSGCRFESCRAHLGQETRRIGKKSKRAPNQCTFFVARTCRFSKSRRTLKKTRTFEPLMAQPCRTSFFELVKILMSDAESNTVFAQFGEHNGDS
jgi:hypothetical protein